MGYKTEINYILKCSTESEGIELLKKKKGDSISITKSGERTFVINSPIMIADPDWKIVGMCLISQSIVNKQSTTLTATILSVFSKKESEIISKVIQDGEKEKLKYL